MFDEKILYYNEEKLEYVINKLKLKSKDISAHLGISPSMLSQIQNHSASKLKPYHLYAMAQAYAIPMEIFQNDDINTPELIDMILPEREKEKHLIYSNELLLSRLLGLWYLYSYPSNSSEKIYATEHTIYIDGTVIDEHENRGKIYFGKNQSLILKESKNSKNLTSITFDNNRVTYECFAFSRVSKSNHLNRELFNFGFFSRDKLEKDEVKHILGKRESVQLQMDYKMLERLSLKIKL